MIIIDVAKHLKSIFNCNHLIYGMLAEMFNPSFIYDFYNEIEFRDDVFLFFWNKKYFQLEQSTLSFKEVRIEDYFPISRSKDSFLSKMLAEIKWTDKINNIFLDDNFSQHDDILITVEIGALTITEGEFVTIKKQKALLEIGIESILKRYLSGSKKEDVKKGLIAIMGDYFNHLYFQINGSSYYVDESTDALRPEKSIPNNEIRKIIVDAFYGYEGEYVELLIADLLKYIPEILNNRFVEVDEDEW